MRKKILLVFFVTFLFLLMPLNASATHLPIVKNDKEEVEKLKNEIEDQELKKQIDEVFDRLIYNNKLDTEELEKILNESYDPDSNPDFIQTDAWSWIIQRLGWVYESIDYFINVFNTGKNLYNQFSYKTQLFLTFFNNLKDIKNTWEDFKVNPAQNFVALVQSLANIIGTTITIIQDLTDDETEVINALNEFSSEVGNFSAFIDSKPWENPILVYGSVDNNQGGVNVSCKGDSSQTEDFYEIYFPTADEDLSYLAHKVLITAEDQNDKISYERYAFSNGEIELNINFDEDESVEKTLKFGFKGKYFNLFERFLCVFSRLLIFLHY